MAFTRNRFQWPQFAGNAFKDFGAIISALDRYFRALEDKGALYPLGDNGSATGTPTAGSGTLTSASYTLTWTAIGDRLFYSGSVVITTNGTGATSLVVPLPSGYIPKENGAGTGCIDSTRVQLAVKVGASAKSIAIVKYDGTYPGADGLTLLFSGQFRF